MKAQDQLLDDNYIKELMGKADIPRITHKSEMVDISPFLLQPIRKKGNDIKIHGCCAR